MLNYDLTFLALLLTGLYEPETVTAEHRCIISLQIKRNTEPYLRMLLLMLINRYLKSWKEFWVRVM
jgi:hypothetical protein